MCIVSSKYFICKKKLYADYIIVLILNNATLTRLKLFEYKKLRKCSKKEH